MLLIDPGFFVVRGGQPQEAMVAALERLLSFRKRDSRVYCGESLRPTIAELRSEGNLSREYGALVEILGGGYSFWRLKGGAFRVGFLVGHRINVSDVRVVNRFIAP